MIQDRPLLHITPPTGWLNDPNGLVHWKGRHHVFYQSDPASLWFGVMQWGHVSSEDLVTWKQHPAALVPSPGADLAGCWSGCIVDDEGVATAIYTGIVKLDNGGKTQSVLIATSTDPELVEWTKDPENPVVIEPPDFEVDAFRDPYVWRDGNGWAMLLGTDLPDGHGGVLLYRSPDLRDWRFRGVLLSGADLPAGAPWTGSVWECPNLAILPSGEALLLISVHDPSTLSLHYTVAVIGTFASDRFIAISSRRLDHGHDCYAAALEKTADGRFLTYGWAWETLSPEDRETQAWSGVMTLPREVGVRDGVLILTPAREIREGATLKTKVESRVVTPNNPLEIVAPSVAVVEATLLLDHKSSFRIALRSSPTSGEELRIDYSGSRGSIVIDRSQASQLVNVLGGQSTAEYPLPYDGRVTLTIIIDGTIVEIFVGNSIAFSERIYPQSADANMIRIESQVATFSEQPATLVVERLTISTFDMSALARAVPALSDALAGPA